MKNVAKEKKWNRHGWKRLLSAGLAAAMCAALLAAPAVVSAEPEAVTVDQLVLNADGVYVTAPTEATTLTATATVTGSGSAQLLAAVYKPGTDGGSTLVQAAVSPENTVADTAKLTATLKNVTAEEQVKYFVWDMTNLRPYTVPEATQPQNLELEGEPFPQRVLLQWKVPKGQAAEKEVTYAVYRDGAEVGKDLTGGGFIDDVADGQTHNYQVKDSKGQVSNTVEKASAKAEDKYLSIKAHGENSGDVTTDIQNGLALNPSEDYMRPITQADPTPASVRGYAQEDPTFKYWSGGYDGSILREKITGTYNGEEVQKEVWRMARMLRDKAKPNQMMNGCIYPEIDPAQYKRLKEAAEQDYLKEIEICVEYYDGDPADKDKNLNDSFFVNYFYTNAKDTNGKRKDLRKAGDTMIKLEYTGQWKVARFGIKDAYFDGSSSILMTDCDFRLETESKNGICVSQVWLGLLKDVPATEDPRTLNQVRSQSADEKYPEGVSWRYEGSADATNIQEANANANGLYLYANNLYGGTANDSSVMVKVKDGTGYAQTIGNEVLDRSEGLPQTWLYFYMEPNDYLWGDADSYVEMTVEYLDDTAGNGEIILHYENAAGAYSGDVRIQRDAGQAGPVKTATVVLNNAFFQGRQNGPNLYRFGAVAFNGLDGRFTDWGYRGSNFRLGMSGQGDGQKSSKNDGSGKQLKIVSVTLKNISHKAPEEIAE